MAEAYAYIGADDRLETAERTPQQQPVANPADLAARLGVVTGGDEPVVTFVIDLDSGLRVGPRRSEHVSLAGGQAVLAAGEIRFEADGDALRVAEVTNQSTGYCPPASTWPAVAAALDGLGIGRPDYWTAEFVFRTCPRCCEVNVIKDDWFVCANCDATLAP